MELPGARAGFSTRLGGVSEGPYESLNLGILTDDDRGRVEQNRTLLAEEAGLDPAAVAMGWQVHGTDLQDMGRAGPSGELEKVDGHVTARDDLALLVLVADCLPVALAGARRDRDGPLRLARARRRHPREGRRGVRLSAGGGNRARESAPAATRSATRCAREFDARFAHGRMLDLRGVAEARLRQAGVDQVEHVDLCTSCRADLFFSHRRDDGVTGRQARPA